jgi:hypothetical protein
MPHQIKITLLGLILCLASTSCSSPGSSQKVPVTQENVVEEDIYASDENISVPDSSNLAGKECDEVDEISPDGNYICAWHGAGVWVLREGGSTKAPTMPTQEIGRWEKNCIFVQVPNPNYDARKGFSAGVNMPTVTKEQCSQVYVQDQKPGRWESKCAFVQVPNPNYDARKGFSAGVNMPTVSEEQCSQVYIQ